VLPRAGSFWRIWGSCATDVWVTGTVPMHFNGGSWSEDLDRPAGLLPISGTSPDDLWIGGAVQTTYGGGAVSHRLLGPIRKCPSPSGIVDLGTLGGTFSQAVDINDAGQVIGATTDVPQNTVPFVWAGGSHVRLDGVGRRIRRAGHRHQQHGQDRRPDGCESCEPVGTGGFVMERGA
jgi:hypothetical protein